ARHETDSPQHTKLVGSLPHAHRHGISDQQHHDRQDQQTDDIDRLQDGAEHAHERSVQRLIFLGKSLVITLVETNIDRPCDLDALARIENFGRHDVYLVAFRRVEALVEVRQLYPNIALRKTVARRLEDAHHLDVD